MTDMERINGKINRARALLTEVQDTITEIEEILTENVPEGFLPDDYHNLDEAREGCDRALGIVTRVQKQIV